MVPGCRRCSKKMSTLIHLFTDLCAKTIPFHQVIPFRDTHTGHEHFKLISCTLDLKPAAFIISKSTHFHLKLTYSKTTVPVNARVLLLKWLSFLYLMVTWYIWNRSEIHPSDELLWYLTQWFKEKTAQLKTVKPELSCDDNSYVKHVRVNSLISSVFSSSVLLGIDMTCL